MKQRTIATAGWATVRTTADFIGITEQGIRKVYLPQLSDDEIDRKSKPMLLKVSAVIEILAQRKAEEIISASSVDPMLTGTSPALERYRMARAELAELELLERKGQLIDCAKAKVILARWANIIRRTGEKLGKKYPPDASELFTTALDECRIAVVEIAGDPSDTENPKLRKR